MDLWSVIGNLGFRFLFSFIILKQIFAFVDMSNCSRGIVFSTRCKYLCIFYMHFGVAVAELCMIRKTLNDMNPARYIVCISVWIFFEN